MGRRETIFELLKEYEETYNRPVPISYDLLKLSDEHRKFDALIRRYWDNLHPLSRDVFTSFANEIQYLMHLTEENEEKLNHNNEELRKIKDEFEKQLEKFEMEFDNRVTEGIATVSNRNYDLMDRENRVLKDKVALIEATLISKDELIENLRDEISLLIDDSREQEESAKLLEENISESINQFNSFTQQLDVFEDVMDTLQSANVVAEREIDTLAEELEFKSELIDEVKLTYQKSLQLSEQKYEALKEKVNQISPQIEKIHRTSKVIHKKNNEFKIENEKLKRELERYVHFTETQDQLESKIGFLESENNRLENEMDHLKAEIEMMRIKKSQQDDILTGYKSIVFDSKGDTINIPVPKKQMYNLNPGQVKEPRIIESKDKHEKEKNVNIPKINIIPDRKQKKMIIPNNQNANDPTKEKQINNIDDDEKEKQIIKDVLIGKNQIPAPKKVDDDLKKSEKSEKSKKSKKSKKSSTKEKLLS